MSLRRKGQRYHTKEQIDAIRKAHTGKIVSVKTRAKRARQVVQKTKEGQIIKVFYSISEATRSTKINNIAGTVRGLQKYAGGFRWEYANPTGEDLIMYVEQQEKKKENCKEGRRKAALLTSKKVIQLCLLTGKQIAIFPSVKAAESSFGGCTTNISNTARGVQKSAYGFGWKYVQQGV